MDILPNTTVISHSHQRYENGVPVFGRQYCDRAIIIQSADFTKILNSFVKPANGYMVRLVNTDINRDQMMPKYMCIASADEESVLLRGIALNLNGITFPSGDHRNYGLKLVRRNHKFVKATLYMYDRNTEIEYTIE